MPSRRWARGWRLSPDVGVLCSAPEAARLNLCGIGQCWPRGFVYSFVKVLGEVFALSLTNYSIARYRAIVKGFERGSVNDDGVVLLRVSRQVRTGPNPRGLAGVVLVLRLSRFAERLFVLSLTDYRIARYRANVKRS